MSQNETVFQTLADVKVEMAVKLSLTSKGYKATVKAADPREAIRLAIKAHLDMIALRSKMEGPTEFNRSQLPVLVSVVAGDPAAPIFHLQHGGGACVPFDPSQDLNEGYVVKIELEMNSKGVGWTVGVKAFSSEAGAAMIFYVEEALAQAFPGGGAA